MGPLKAIRKSKKLEKPSFSIYTCPYPGRLAYIYAPSFMIVGIDTVASDDGGHRVLEESVGGDRGG